VHESYALGLLLLRDLGLFRILNIFFFFGLLDDLGEISCAIQDGVKEFGK